MSWGPTSLPVGPCLLEGAAPTGIPMAASSSGSLGEPSIPAVPPGTTAPAVRGGGGGGSPSDFVCVVDESGGLADPKPVKRIRDREALARWHSRDWSCVSCGSSRVQAHHILGGSRKADDVEAALVPLCLLCHTALHSGGTVRGDFGRRVTAEVVRQGIGRWLRSEAGEDARLYLTGRLGAAGAREWWIRQFGEEWAA